jgi:cytochrome c peroxidase
MTRQQQPSGHHGWSPLVILLLVLGAADAADAQIQTFNCTAPEGFTDEAAVPGPLLLLTSLKSVENPVLPKDPFTGAITIRADLVQFIADLPAAIQLGKALFWDMQVGSDNKMACATCHFNAGADIRNRNQLNPGPNRLWDGEAYGPNSVLWEGGFPFTMETFDTDNVVSSQGIRRAQFVSIDAAGNETLTAIADAIFNVNGVNVRQVPNKNAPPVVNAVFNHRNFLNGRAQPEFNGVNPFGSRDTAARVYAVNSLGGATKVSVLIKDASLASQAVGPPLNTMEMSASGRTFPDVGRKLLRRKPLGLQQVSTTDSVLGPLADVSKGLATTYAALIQRAFMPKWWNSKAQVLIGTKYYTVMEANFSLYFGLSVMLYEATLVSDETPIDKYLEYRTAGGDPDPTVLDPVVTRLQAEMPGLTRQNILNGLELFEMPTPPAPTATGVGCIFCHGSAEMTNASVRQITFGIEPPDHAFRNAGFDLRMERMFMEVPPVPEGTNQVTLDPSKWTVTAANTLEGTSRQVNTGVYDIGFYNIGVRPTADDLGLDGTDPWGKPLSFVRFFQQKYLDPSFLKIPGDGLACNGVMLTNSTGQPLLAGGLRKAEAAVTAGSFKVPGLRNVELTGPYFHNGGKATLAQVVEFYDDGGDFSNPTLAPLIRPLGMSDEEVRDLTAFLLALTDERVRRQEAPFDHPQLFLPNGDEPNALGIDSMVELPAVGAAGGFDLQRFLNLDPFKP